METPTQRTCSITQRIFPITSLVQGIYIKKQIRSLIKKDHPNFSDQDFINIDELNKYRRKYLEILLRKERKSLSHLDKKVITAIQDNTLLSDDFNPEAQTNLSIGQKTADKIAEFGGSWKFIILFFLFLLIWMAINIWVLSKAPFDPYPFILLNLILSCLAAIQAPIIMMSQNRKEQRDRKRNEQDYQINLKAELELRLLHEKIDHMMNSYNKHLLSIQDIQLDYLERIVSDNQNTKNSNQNDKKT